MKQTTLPGESKRANHRPVKSSNTINEVSQSTTDPMEKSQSKIRETYQEYETAQKDFQKAFKEREKENQEAFENSEKKYRDYEDRLEIAFKNREVAEQAALEDYRKSLENARIVYLESMKKALKGCKKSTDEARNLLVGIAPQESQIDSRRTILFTLRVRKPDLKPVKKGFSKISQWFTVKKPAIVKKDEVGSPVIEPESMVH